MKLLKFRVADRIDETPLACSFALEPLDGAAVDYRPGQYLSLRVPHPEGAVFRCYSLSSSPVLGERLRVTVKREPGGRGSNWLCDHLQAGDELQALPPAGDFVPTSLDEPLLLFGGGSGITPVFSILKSALSEGSAPVRLIYANRDRENIIFARELEEWQARYPERLAVVHLLDAEQGVPTVEGLAELAAGWEQARAFICGPGPFMEGAAAALARAGLPEERVHLEFFTAPQPVAGEEAEQGDASALTVELSGETRTIPCGEQTYLLDAMLAAGMNAPSSCRAGNCGTCMCELQEGEVDLGENAVLEDEDVEDGWILACRAKPRSEKVRIAFTG